MKLFMDKYIFVNKGYIVEQIEQSKTRKSVYHVKTFMQLYNVAYGYVQKEKYIESKYTCIFIVIDYYNCFQGKKFKKFYIWDLIHEKNSIVHSGKNFSC